MQFVLLLVRDGGNLWVVLPSLEWDRVSAGLSQRLRAMKVLLQAERVGARLRTRTFETRFVLERQTSDILVVTDSPEANSERLSVRTSISASGTTA